MSDVHELVRLRARYLLALAATDTARVKDPKQCCYLFTNRRAPLGRPSTR